MPIVRTGQLVSSGTINAEGFSQPSLYRLALLLLTIYANRARTNLRFISSADVVCTSRSRG